jgi:hypothetical protein
MGFDGLKAEVEAEAAATVIRIGLVEALEQVGQGGVEEAWTGITHHDQNLGLLPLEPTSDPHPTGFGFLLSEEHIQGHPGTHC